MIISVAREKSFSQPKFLHSYVVLLYLKFVGKGDGSHLILSNLCTIMRSGESISSRQICSNYKLWSFFRIFNNLTSCCVIFSSIVKWLAKWVVLDAVTSDLTINDLFTLRSHEKSRNIWIPITVRKKSIVKTPAETAI